jgi:hypothetical protein
VTRSRAADSAMKLSRWAAMASTRAVNWSGCLGCRAIVRGVPRGSSMVMVFPSIAEGGDAAKGAWTTSYNKYYVNLCKSAYRFLTVAARYRPGLVAASFR